MDSDEKTARGMPGPPRPRAAPPAGGPQSSPTPPSVPIGRPTAPVGTPNRISASPDPGAPLDPPPPPPPRRVPSDRPMDTLTPPRTVGGHTARLNIPEGELAPPSDPVPPKKAPSG